MATNGGRPPGGFWGPFVLGVAAGVAGMAAYAAASKRRLDPRLFGSPVRHDLTPVVVVPGIMGSALRRPDGAEVWLNWGNAVGSHAIALPPVLPLAASRDELLPAGLLGTDRLLPRIFGFTEYADLVELLEAGGFRTDGATSTYHLFTYDWRRDIVEAARRLDETLERLADERGDPEARFHVIGHSMGGLVARYYLRYGGAEPGGPVTWAGARRLRTLVLVATPSGGSIASLDAVLNGSRVGLSTTTLASSVVASMPAIFALLPPAGAPALVDPRGHPIEADLHDPATWRRFGWGPHAPSSRRGADVPSPERRAFFDAALERAQAVHRALAVRPDTPCPARVLVLGGDCLPTLGRAVVPERVGVPPRFEALNSLESEVMFEAGDGRVTRASVLASHLPGALGHEDGCGLPEVGHVLLGSADHHGLYREPTFQSVLLRLFLRPARRLSADSMRQST